MSVPALIDDDTLAGVLGEALRTGGDFAEVFAEDKASSSAYLDDGRIEELSSGRDRVLSAADGLSLRASLDTIYRGKILAEAVDAGETLTPPTKKP